MSRPLVPEAGDRWGCRRHHCRLGRGGEENLGRSAVPYRCALIAVDGCRRPDAAPTPSSGAAIHVPPFSVVWSYPWQPRCTHHAGQHYQIDSLIHYFLIIIFFCNCMFSFIYLFFVCWFCALACLVACVDYRMLCGALLFRIDPWKTILQTLTHTHTNTYTQKHNNTTTTTTKSLKCWWRRPVAASGAATRTPVTSPSGINRQPYPRLSRGPTCTNPASMTTIPNASLSPTASDSATRAAARSSLNRPPAPVVK